MDDAAVQLWLEKLDPPVEGLLAYYDLIEWWVSELSIEERSRIKEVCDPDGELSLASGAIEQSSGNAVKLINSLVLKLHSPDDRPLALKLLNKAEEIAAFEDSVGDLHVIYDRLIEIHHLKRMGDATSHKEAVRVCEAQTRMASAVAQGLLAGGMKNLPTHRGFEVLSELKEKDGVYEDAIFLCRSAELQGWSGNWSKRIKYLEKKLSPARRKKQRVEQKYALGMAGVSSRIENMESELEDQRVLTEQFEQHALSYQQTNAQIVEKLESEQRSLLESRMREQALVREIRELRSAQSEASHELAAERQALSELRQQCTVRGAELKAVQLELKAMREHKADADIAIARLTEETNAARALTTEKESESKSLMSDISRQESLLREAEALSSILEEKLSGIGTESESLRTELRAAKDALHTIETASEKTHEDLYERDSRILEMEAANAVESQQIEELQKQLSEARYRLESMQQSQAAAAVATDQASNSEFDFRAGEPATLEPKTGNGRDDGVVAPGDAPDEAEHKVVQPLNGENMATSPGELFEYTATGQTNSHMVFDCQSCGQRLRIRRQYAGMVGRCRSCGEETLSPRIG